MPLKTQIKLPAKLWSKADTMRLAQNTLASIRIRTSKGIDANGIAFKEYSDKKIYIPLNSGTGARLKPKGGVLSRTGRSMRFDGGYREYKDKSRMRGRRNKYQDDSAEVDLVLSGSLMNNLVVLKAERTRFIIGLTSHVRYYGYAVNDKREYLGLSQRDVQILFQTVKDEISRKIERGTK
jgi:hypothetical protein